MSAGEIRLDDARTWPEAEREDVLAAYKDMLSGITASLERSRPDVPVGVTIGVAQAILCRTVNSAIDEAVGRLRVERGLPAFAEPGPEPTPPSSGDGTHRAVARELAEETLRSHSGGEIDDQSVQDLLVDLMHHAGPEAFDDALDSALERFEEEVEEDAEAAAEEGEPDPVRRAQIARLRDYQPARHDA